MSVQTTASIIDVISMELGQPHKKQGRWYTWPCPEHADGDRDGGSLRATADTNTFFCFGCRWGGDVLTWLQKRQNLSFAEACQKSGVVSAAVATKPVVKQQLAAVVPPDPEWQTACGELVEQARKLLWTTTGRRARDYLARRGLQDDTLQRWEIGYSPGQRVYKGRTIFRGIVIPIRVDGALWAVKIRQETEPRYIQVRGSLPTLWGAETLTQDVALLCEGEFDAMLAWQEAGDLVGTASPTGGAGVWRREWAVLLLAAKTILVAFDTDAPGEEAATRLLTSTTRGVRVRVPRGKDLTEYWESGGDVRAWVSSFLPEQPVLTSCPICGGRVFRRGVCEVCSS